MAFECCCPERPIGREKEREFGEIEKKQLGSGKDHLLHTVETTNCVRQSEFSRLLGGVSGDSKPNSKYSCKFKKENRFNFNVLKLKNKSRFQSTSLEVRVKIRSKSSTNSLNVGRSMGLYCQHSRISKYLHSNRHTEKKICEIGTNLLKMIKIKDLHFERAADWLLHTMAVAKELEESLNVGHRRIRRAAQGHNLPEEDAE